MYFVDRVSLRCAWYLASLWGWLWISWWLCGSWCFLSLLIALKDAGPVFTDHLTVYREGEPQGPHQGSRRGQAVSMPHLWSSVHQEDAPAWPHEGPPATCPGELTNIMTSGGGEIWWNINYHCLDEGTVGDCKTARLMMMLTNCGIVWVCILGV